jgi:hypothetical protein
MHGALDTTVTPHGHSMGTHLLVPRLPRLCCMTNRDQTYDSMCVQPTGRQDHIPAPGARVCTSAGAGGGAAAPNAAGRRAVDTTGFVGLSPRESRPLFMPLVTCRLGLWALLPRESRPLFMSLVTCRLHSLEPCLALVFTDDLAAKARPSAVKLSFQEWDCLYSKA